MNIKRYSEVLHIVFLALIIAGCGGGGGGGSNNPAAPAGGGGGGGGAISTITQANAAVYAAEILYMGDLLGIGDIVDFAVSVEAEDKQHGRFNLAEFVDWQVDTLMNLPYEITPTSIVAVFPDPKTEDCGASPADGTVGIVWNDNGDSVISAGDTAVVTFNGCKGALFGDDKITGTVNIDVLSAIGLTSVSANITFSGLQLEWDTGSETDDATLTINASRPSVDTTSTGILGSLNGAGTDDGFSYSYSYNNMNLLRTGNDTSGAYSASVEGDVIDSDLGSYSVNTFATFDGNDNNTPDNPETGNAMITAQDNSSVTINVLDNINVELQVDTDGDLLIDFTFNVTWDDLNNA